MKSVVVPGEQIPGGVKSGNIYIENGKAYATVLGLYDEEGKRIITLEGAWAPKIDETVVGIVEDAGRNRVNGKKEVMLSNPRLLKGGAIIKIKPTKIPRVLGKANTMAKQISELTKCDMVVGSNGIVWVRGENMALAIAAILRIESDAHVSGLTEKIKEMLVNNTTKRL